MRTSISGLAVFALAFACLLAAGAGEASAQDVLAGFDLYETIPGETHRDFTADPIPADFFGPGSDPFDGIIYLEGQPLGGSVFCPVDDLSRVDMIIHREERAELPDIPSSDSVPIEIVELSLVSVEPIRVTYFGGADEEYWDVEMTISPHEISHGMLFIERDAPDGGTYSGDYLLYPRFTFTHVGGPEEWILDYGETGIFDHYEIYDGVWQYWDPLPGSCMSNFCAGVSGPVLHLAPNGRHDVLAVCPTLLDGTVYAGFDLYETIPETTFQDFATHPVPPDFFGPGSDPFDGTITYVGQPLEWSPFCPEDDLSQVDTIVERLADAELPTAGSVATVPLEIVELSLVSAEPITVTYMGGMDPQMWEVHATLSPGHPSLGDLTLVRLDSAGGVLEAFIVNELNLVLTFHHLGGPEVSVWDLGADGISEFLAAGDLPWYYWDSPSWSCTSNICINPYEWTLLQGQTMQHGLYSICVEGSAVEDGETAPMGLSLAPNAPNPMGDWTRITYSVDRAHTSAVLDIVDVLGRRVTRLANALHAPGTHSVVWDGTSDSGVRVPAGVYYSRLSVGHESATRPVILLR